MTNNVPLSFAIFSQYLVNLGLLAHAVSRRKDVTAYRCLKTCIYMALKSERRNRLLPSIFVAHKQNNSHNILLDSLPNTLAEMVLITFTTSVTETHSEYPLVTATMTRAFQVSAGDEKYSKDENGFSRNQRVGEMLIDTNRMQNTF